MKNPKSLPMLFSLLILMGFVACKEDKNQPTPVNEEELITSVYLQFIDSASSDTTIFSFVDLDGDGGNPPVITNANLNQNSTYAMSVSFLNEAEIPVEDITLEVIEEGDEHQIFYQVESGLDLAVIYSTVARNTDANGRPIGVEGIASTGTVSSGKLKVTLRHEPNKAATGASQGDITGAGGETDIEVEFSVSVQ